MARDTSTEQLTLVDTGHDPSPEALARAPKYPPAYAPCPGCGLLVLAGETLEGVQVALETQGKSYVPVWPNDAPRPTLYESRGYPVHRCVGAKDMSQRGLEGGRVQR